LFVLVRQLRQSLESTECGLDSIPIHLLDLSSNAAAKGTP
jgi:hypothetical protein